MSVPVSTGSAPTSVDCDVPRAEPAATPPFAAGAGTGPSDGAAPAGAVATGRVRVLRRVSGPWWVTFLVVGALGAVWSVVTPLYSVPDEPSHSVWAAAVARGQLLPGERGEVGYTTFVDVPAVFDQADDVTQCYASHVREDCPSLFHGPDRTTSVETSAGLYPPAWYGVVGLPSLVAESALGVHLMRLVSAAVFAALVASAVASLWTLRTRWLGLAAVATALTPKAMFLAGSVNPNGIEIAAAIALWSPLAVLLLESSEPGPPLLEPGVGTAPAVPEPGSSRRRLTFRVAAAGLVLAVTRPGSPLWLAMIVAAVVAAAGMAPLRALLRDRAAWVAVAAPLAAAATTVAWVAHYGTLDQTLAGGPRDGTLWDNTRFALELTGVYLDGMVGLFGTGSPDPHVGTPIRLWYVALGALLVLAVATVRRRHAAVLLGLAVAVVATPVLLQVPRAAEQGFPWQARYTLPLAVGLPILAAVMVDRAPGVPARLANRLGVAVLALVVGAHAFGFWLAEQRFASGLDSLTAG